MKKKKSKTRQENKIPNKESSREEKKNNYHCLHLIFLLADSVCGYTVFGRRKKNVYK